MHDAPRSRTRLWQVLANATWLVADKVLRLGVGLVVGVWIARHLGPEQFGTWSYALAFAAVFGFCASLGLDSIVVRDLVRDPQQRPTLLATGFLLRLVAGIACLLAACAAMALVRPGQPMTLLLVCIAGLGFVFQAALVVDFDLQAQSRNRISVLAQNAVFLLMTCVKVGLLYLQAPLLAFAIAGTAEVGLGMIFLLASYVWRGGHIDLRAARWATARRLLADSWPLLIGGVAVSLYMRIDQIMLGAILGDHAVGVYSVAVRLSEAWYFIPMAISTAVFPAVLALRQSDPEAYQKRMQLYFDLMSALGIVAAVVTTFVGNWLVLALFGTAYAAAGPLLVLHAWAGVFACLSVASAMWLSAEGLQLYAMIRTILGCLCNVAINALLIPTLGMTGAVIGTLLSFGVATFAVLLFPRTRVCGIMQLKALSPIRLLALCGEGIRRIINPSEPRVGP